MANWNAAKAKAWLTQMGRSHVRDGLDHEGKVLIAMAATSSVDETSFRSLIKAELWWPEAEIDVAVREVVP